MVHQSNRRLAQQSIRSKKEGQSITTSVSHTFDKEDSEPPNEGSGRSSEARGLPFRPIRLARVIK
jgi:hypothetical protein